MENIAFYFYYKDGTVKKRRGSKDLIEGMKDKKDLSFICDTKLHKNKYGFWTAS